MSLKDTDIKTPGDKSIAKKWKLPLSKVKQLVDRGADHEKEHNTNREKAKQVARDHIEERPDYYKMLDKADKMDKNKLDEFKTDNFPSSNSIEDRRSPERKADDSKLSPGKDIGDANGPSYSIMKSPQDWGNSTDKPDFGYDSGAQNLRAPRQKEPFTNDQDKVSPTLKQDKSYWPEPVKAIKNKPELSLNELSNKLMKKYMKRAKGELNARDYVTRSGGDYQKKPDLFQHGPAWPGDHEVTDQYAKIHKRQRGMERATALMNIREVKTHGRVSRPGWKPIKDSTTPASPGEPKGDAMKNAFDRIEKAFPKGSIKVGGRKEMKEDTVNEIANTPKGQSTLVKYVRGAAKDLHNTGLIHGYDSAANPRPNGGETETRKNMKRNAKNRTVGIERAVKRMNPGLKEASLQEMDPGTAALMGTAVGSLGGMAGRLIAHKYKEWKEKRAEKPSMSAKDTRAFEKKKRQDYMAKHPKKKLKEEQMDITEISSKLATRYYDKADKDLPKQKKNSRKLHNRQTGIQRAMKRGIEDDYIKRTGYNEETTMEKQDMVAEAINNILEGNLENMRQNLFDVLQETAIEKLEERKKEIASNYFAQD